MISYSHSLPSKVDAHRDRLWHRVLICFAVVAMALQPLACASSEADPIRAMARAIVDARERGDADPLLRNGRADFDERTAYEVQRLLVKTLSRHSAIAGFKAALTSPAAQQRFGVAEPVFGVLFEQGRLEPGAAVPITAFRSPLVETEIGYWLRVAVSQPVPDAQAMRALIHRVALVVELPDMRFASMSSVSAPDLIATNAGSAYFVVGPELGSGCDPNALEVSLEGPKSGVSPRTELSRGRGDEPFGDQFEALRWLLNAAVRAGYTVLPDQLLITGAIGGVTRGAPGRYVARYSARYRGCGEVGFTLGSDSE